LRADADRDASILARIPIGRWGNPDDIASVAVFLASPAARYINGEVLTVDGGWMGR
jgi:2-deoxy-D-gluconate 3-dehydrogenase